MTGYTKLRKVIYVSILICLAAGADFAQTTSFTYQGKLTDAGLPANGPYDITFKLFDTLANGTQVGTDITRDDVPVVDGIFSVDLDFGVAAFAAGSSRFLQVEVRPGASSGVYAALVPRQPVTSSPYGIKAISATTADSLSPACAACVADANIDTVSASKVSGILNQASGGTGVSTPGAAGNFLRSDGTSWTSSPFQASDIPTLSASFIQNSTTAQATSNFNISGTGTANIFNAATEFRINGNHALSAPGNFNLFAGVGAGNANSTGGSNSFFGPRAGFANTTGLNNSFFGAQAGDSNSAGFNNSFFGYISGYLNSTGNNNSFFGSNAGSGNTSGNSLTLVGASANVGADNLVNATAIGAGAIVSSSNSVVLGRNLDTVQVPGNLNVTGSFTGGFTVPTTNITGVLAQANGGTGVTSPGAAGNFLRSDGTNWTSSPFQASDIPALNNSFIQNIPGVGQQSASFNIDGGGNANTFNATTQFNIGGNRVLSAPGTENLFGGVGAGQSNTTGASNTFFGTNAGFTNTFGGLNTFFGFEAGQYNLFGDSNSFFGRQAGHLNTSGSFNVAFGALAGQRNSQGNYITTIGALADVENLTAFPNNATAIGALAFVSQDNSLVLGSINGVNSCGPPYCNSVNVGIGTTAPQQRLHVNGDEILSTGTAGGFKFRNRGSTSPADDWVWYSSGNIARFFRTGVGDLITVQTNGNVGIGTSAPDYKLDVVGRSRVKQRLGDVASTNTAGFWLFQNVPNQDQAFVGMEDDLNVGFYGRTGGWGLVMSTVTGVTAVRALGAGGLVPLCWNVSNEISTCGSSLRYKTNIGRFGPGMSFVNQLRPISFDWKDGGLKDVGFGAEDIAKIDPRFVTYNDKGEVEGVKYDRLSVAFVNAFKEQQAEISDLTAKLKLQQAQIDTLKKLVCAQNPAAEICKEEK